MESFIQRHQAEIKGVLSGLDRTRFRGRLRSISHPWGLTHFLLAAGIYLKDFKDSVLGLSRQILQATNRLAREAKRPLDYLPSSMSSKEEQARAAPARFPAFAWIIRSTPNC